ncbi:MAG: DUF6544 family protein [Candidatus Manganitrophaceae bacterium]
MGLKTILLIVVAFVGVVAGAIAFGSFRWKTGTDRLRAKLEGLMSGVRAGARYRTVNGVLVATPWQGRFWNYEVRNGMRIPLEGEVAWEPPEGLWPYWRGRVTEIVYQFAR